MCDGYNPKIVKQANAYALACKAGKEKEARAVLNRLINMIDNETKLKATKYFISERSNNND